jgi:uncharacterized protein YbcI
MASRGRAHELSPAAQISRGMVRLLAEYTGRGPTRARTTVNTNMVAVFFEDTLTRAELKLAAAGESDAVQATRRIFHDLMRQEAVALVSEVLGREVVSFLSDVDAAANVAGVMFLLEPRRETGLVEVVESGPKAEPAAET